jgi:hypothetical protein
MDDLPEIAKQRRLKMTRVITYKTRTALTVVAMLTGGLLAASTGQAWAFGGSFGSAGHSVGQSFETSRGPAFVTGNVGSMQTTTLPGSGGVGLLSDNGNGTSTLLVPGGVPQVVATPR